MEAKQLQLPHHPSQTLHEAPKKGLSWFSTTSVRCEDTLISARQEDFSLKLGLSWSQSLNVLVVWQKVCFLAPRCLPIHTDCNWKSNVHKVCQLHWDSFLITRLKMWKQYNFILSEPKAGFWWQSCRGEQKNQTLFYKMTEPALSYHLKLQKHLFCCRRKEIGQLHSPRAEPCGHSRGCWINHFPPPQAKPPSSHIHVYWQLPDLLLLFLSAF